MTDQPGSIPQQWWTGEDWDVLRAALADGEGLTSRNDRARLVFAALTPAVERIRREERAETDATIAELRAEVDARPYVSRVYFTREKLRAEAAEAERDELAGRLSALLCELTNGRMSKTNYDVRTMVTEIDSAYDDAQQEDRANAEDAEARVAEKDATVAKVRELAGLWQARAKHQFDYAKTVPPEIRPSLTDAAAEMEDYALKVLAILDAPKDTTAP